MIFFHLLGYLVYVGTSGAIYLTNVYCKGNEASLLECNYSQHTQSCSHYEDVGVQCLTTRADSMSMNHDTVT